MAYDEDLAARIRRLIADRPGFSEKKMFGGIAFFLNRNMACGVLREDLILKIKGKDEDEALTRPGCRPFDFTGRPMRGIVIVAGAEVIDDTALSEWLDPALRQVSKLPAKQPRPPRTRPPGTKRSPKA